MFGFIILSSILRVDELLGIISQGRSIKEPFILMYSGKYVAIFSCGKEVNFMRFWQTVLTGPVIKFTFMVKKAFGNSIVRWIYEKIKQKF